MKKIHVLKSFLSRELETSPGAQKSLKKVVQKAMWNFSKPKFLWILHNQRCRSGSGSSVGWIQIQKGEVTHKNRKKGRISCSELMDVLFKGPKASPSSLDTRHHHKNLKILNFFKIFLEPSTRVSKAFHTTFYFWLFWIFWVIKRMLSIRLIRYSQRKP